MQSKDTQDIRKLGTDHVIILKNPQKLQEKWLKCYIAVVTPVFLAEISVSHAVEVHP